MLRVVLSVVLASSAAFAQNVISAKAGLVNYHDGEVTVGGEPIQNKPSQFTSLKVGQELRTGEGRAEVLLTPGVFLRIGENSAVRMISNSLTDPKVALITGSALVQAMDVAKDTPITVIYGDRAALLSKTGIYRFDASESAASLRVYEGEAKVGEMDVKKGREMALTGNGDSKEIAKFDTKDTDELYRWASRRDQYISMANVSAAKSTTSSTGCGAAITPASYPVNGTYGGVGGYAGRFASAGNPNSNNGGYYGQQGGWRFNSCYGMYTYVPYNGIYQSPFGWSYFSPSQVVYLYNPNNYPRGGGNAVANTGNLGHGATHGSGVSGFPTASYPSAAPNPSGQGVGYSSGNSAPAGAAAGGSHHTAPAGGGGGAGLGSGRGPK